MMRKRTLSHAVVPVRDHCTHDDGKRGGHRQVDSNANGKRRNAQLVRCTEKCVEQNETDADDCPDAKHLPLQTAADYTLRERGDQRRLRCRQRMFRIKDADVRRACEAIGSRQQVKYEWDH
jgi:hypothetical protein